MKIDEFDAPEISFAIEFKKDMNFNINNLKNEIDLYLMESLKKKSNILDILMWWKVNSSIYPILSQIARDLLVMRVSTVVSEYAFST